MKEVEQVRAVQKGRKDILGVPSDGGFPKNLNKYGLN